MSEARSEEEADPTLERLEASLQEEASSVLLRGEPGAGKTALMHRIESLQAGALRTVFLPFFHVPPEQAARLLLGWMGRDPHGGDAQLRSVLEEGDRPTLLLLDEAQSIPPETAARLTSVISSARADVRVVWAGTPCPRLDAVAEKIGNPRILDLEPLAELPKAFQAREPERALAPALSPLPAPVPPDPASAPAPGSEVPPELVTLPELEAPPERRELLRPAAAMTPPQPEPPSAASRTVTARVRAVRGAASGVAPLLSGARTALAGASRELSSLGLRAASAVRAGMDAGLRGLARWLRRLAGGLGALLVARQTRVVAMLGVVFLVSAWLTQRVLQQLGAPASAPPPGIAEAEPAGALLGGVAPAETPEPPAAPVRINVNAVPWARVWVDGRDLGTTPLGGIELSEGEHDFEVEYADGARVTYALQIGARTAFVSFRPEREPQARPRRQDESPEGRLRAGSPTHSPPEEDPDMSSLLKRPDG